MEADSYASMPEEYNYASNVALRAKYDALTRWTTVSNGEFTFCAVGALTSYDGTVRKWMCDSVMDEGGFMTPIAWYKKTKMMNLNGQSVPVTRSMKCFFR